jgi:hypothetical protein
MQFQDWANPTKEEINTWAYEVDSFAPEQDFNLICAEDEYIDLVLELAADKSCPKNIFFLQCLYIYVGDKVKSGLTVKNELLEKAKKIDNELIQKWLIRAAELINNPTLYNYTDWGDAQLATK